MQIIFLPPWLAILLVVVIWPLLQVPISAMGNAIPDRRFDAESFFFKSRNWEKDGKFYEKVFKIRKWKERLPDGAKLFKAGFEKGELKTKDPEYIEAFIKETCRAELVHWLQILPFWVFGLWAPPFIIWIMLAYALAANLPCILAQRYNRPRLKRIYHRLMKYKTGVV